MHINITTLDLWKEIRIKDYNTLCLKESRVNNIPRVKHLMLVWEMLRLRELEWMLYPMYLDLWKEIKIKDYNTLCLIELRMRNILRAKLLTKMLT